MGIRSPLPINGLGKEDREILEKSADWTMCSGLQKQFMLDATRYVIESGIHGDIVECGVWRGGMMQIAARTLIDFHRKPANESVELPKIWLYDTYAGMRAPDSPLDRDLYRGEHASHKLDRELPRVRRWRPHHLVQGQFGRCDSRYARNGLPRESNRICCRTCRGDHPQPSAADNLNPASRYRLVFEHVAYSQPPL